MSTRAGTSLTTETHRSAPYYKHQTQYVTRFVGGKIIAHCIGIWYHNRVPRIVLHVSNILSPRHRKYYILFTSPPSPRNSGAACGVALLLFLMDTHMLSYTVCRNAGYPLEQLRAFISSIKPQSYPFYVLDKNIKFY